MNNFYLRFNHEIWNNDDLTLAERLIVNFIWNFQAKSGSCFAENAYIATVFNMHVEDVSKLIAELESRNHIKILEREPRRLMVVNTRLYPVE